MCHVVSNRPNSCTTGFFQHMFKSELWEEHMLQCKTQIWIKYCSHDLMLCRRRSECLKVLRKHYLTFLGLDPIPNHPKALKMERDSPMHNSKSFKVLHTSFHFHWRSKWKERIRERNISVQLLIIHSSFCFSQLCHGDDWKAAPCLSRILGFWSANPPLIEGERCWLLFRPSTEYYDSKSPFLEERKAGFISTQLKLPARHTSLL